MRGSDFMVKPSAPLGKTLWNCGLYAQIALGLLLGVLNVPLNRCVNALGVPLFMDQAMPFAAAFFGYGSGFVCALTYHAISSLLNYSFALPDFLFFLCSLSTVLTVRLCFRKRTTVSFELLIFVGFFLAFLISILGGIIFAVDFKLFGYDELSSLRFLTLLLVHNKLPLVLAAILSRIPTNLADKLLSVFLGYALVLFIKECLQRLPFLRPRQ